MPARTIPPNFRSSTGTIPSQKLGRSVAWESPLERDFYIELEFDPAVRTYEEQPFEIKYIYRGRERPHTPDVLVEFEDSTGRRPELIQVKGVDDLRINWHKFKPGLKAACKYARLHGWRFRIMTERQIRTPYMQNAKCLLPFRWRPCAEYDQKRILDFVAGYGPISLGDLTQRVGFGGAGIVYWLLAFGKLTADLDVLITETTVVSVP